MDYTGTTCQKCKNGTYQELYLSDDWDGTLHCNSCGSMVYRYGLISHINRHLEIAKDDIIHAKKALSLAQETCDRRIAYNNSQIEYYSNLLEEAKKQESGGTVDTPVSKAGA